VDNHNPQSLELITNFFTKNLTMVMITQYQTFLYKELSISFFIFLITHFIISFLFKKNLKKLPPGPKGFPVVGALPLMGSMPHVTLFKMSQKYGPIMYLKMGSNNMVVASTPSSAKAFLKTLDLNFSNRPPNAGATHLAYDSQDLVFADYGSRWKLLRKLSNLHMLGGKALEDWSKVREIEMGHMIRTMYDCSKKDESVVVAEMLTYAMANMIGQVILSRRVFETKGSDSNEFKDMVVELMTTAGYFNIGDFIPLLAWLDLQGIERGMKSLHKKFDALLTKMIEEHVASGQKSPRVKPDLLDTLIAQSKEDCNGEKLTLTNIKALLLVCIINPLFLLLIIFPLLIERRFLLFLVI
jgi:flavonoid 3',5'-hydroxylase